MKRKLLYSLLASAIVSGAAAQKTSRGDIFLNGRYLEVGIGTNGTLGSGDSSPAGYHPLDCSYGTTRIAIVADPDKDGWTIGTPIQRGDYILPGQPAEGWEIQQGDSLRGSALRTGGDSSFTAGLSGYNVRQYFLGKENVGLWQGAYAGLEISQRVQVNEDKLSILFYITITNTTTQTIKDIYYNRMVDADNEVCYTGDYNTMNKIESQIPNPGQHVSVSASGIGYNQPYLGLHTKDCRAKAYILNYVLLSSFSLDTLYKGIGGAVDNKYAVLDSLLSDAGIGIVFKLDSLAARESTTLSYAYILDKTEAADLLATSANPYWSYKDSVYHSNDTIIACEGDVIDVSLFAPGPGTWLWDTSVYLENLSGNTNRITVHDTNTYRAIRNTCGEPDTMYLTVCGVIAEKPVLSLVGTVLSVTPATYVSYQWYKDDVAEPGATTIPYRVTVAGKYAVQVTDANGCVSNSDTIDVAILSVNETASGQDIRIFPNPVSSVVQVRAPFPIQATLTDLSGRVLLYSKEARELDLSPFADGLYLLRITDAEGRTISTQKLLKQKDR